MKKLTQKGQTLFEVVVAVGILTVVMVAVVGLVSQVQRNTNVAKNRSEGARLIQEAAEWLRSERDADWGAFYARSSGGTTWCLNTLAWSQHSACSGNATGKPFRREVIFTRSGASQNTVQADVRVAWTDSQGNHEIRSATHFTNWREQ